MSGVAANISGRAPATSATARRLRFPTSCVLNLPSMAWAFPITPTTGLVIFRALTLTAEKLANHQPFSCQDKAPIRLVGTKFFGAPIPRPIPGSPSGVASDPRHSENGTQDRVDNLRPLEATALCP